jgi:septal ring factor EnvC (AmiA/AmiB activator)
MKTFLSMMVSIFLFMVVAAQTTEFISNKDFQTEKKKLYDGINAVKKTGLEAKKTLAKQNQTMDSLTQLIKVYQVQLAKSNDSLSSMSVKVNNLQNKVDQKKTSLRNRLIFAFGFLFLLVVLSFIWIYRIKKKSDQNFLSLSEAGEKTDSKLDQGLNIVSEDVKGCIELIKVSSNDLNQQLRTGLEHFEIRAGQIEQQIKNYTAIIEEKINKTKEEHDLLLTKQEEKLNKIQSFVDQKNQELMALINSVEKTQKGIAPGILDNLSALKTQLEEKIKSLSAEISKFKM